MKRILLVTVAALVLAGGASTAPAAAQAAPASTMPRVSVTFEATPIGEVAGFFAHFADRSIVVGPDVAGVVTATIADQPWDVALSTILTTHRLRGTELPSGIIVVEAMRAEAHVGQGLVTRTFRLNYARAEELRAAVESVLSPRGRVSVLPGFNALVVTDVADVVGRVGTLIGSDRGR